MNTRCGEIAAEVFAEAFAEVFAEIFAEIARLEDQAAGASSDHKKEQLQAAADTFKEILEFNYNESTDEKHTALVEAFQAYRDTDLDRAQHDWVSQQMRAMGAQPAPPNMEHSKRNPRQLRVKNATGKIDAVTSQAICRLLVNVGPTDCLSLQGSFRATTL